jgi:resuscitation-promoting factor RpfB
MFPRAPRSRPLRRAHRVVSLSLVGLLALPLIAWSNRVDVVVDGELHGLRTYAPTVGDVLDELELEVGPSDEITPAPGTVVSDGLTIDVARAIAVDVFVDGRLTHRVEAPVSSVAGVLTEADLADVRDEGARIRPGWRAPVEDGDAVHVTLPQVVQVTADGETREVETVAGTVEALLLEHGIDVGPSDLVLPIPGAAVEPDTHVVVQRVGHGQVVEQVTLPFEEIRRETDDLRDGTTEVEQEGREGIRFDSYALTQVDGEETKRELISSELVREPTPRIVLVGTFVPPPPPKPEPKPAAPKPEPKPAAPKPAAPKPAATKPAPAPSPTATAPSTPRNHWDDLARCESGGNWSLNTGNGYHGGLQFHPSTWNAHKPSGYPTYAYQATREQQIVVGERVQRSQGWGAWPHCSRQAGLR